MFSGSAFVKYLVFLLVMIVPVSYGQTQTNFTTQIVIKPQKEITISSQLQGKIHHINFKEGDQFETGQVLMKFDCVVHESQLAKAKAKLRQALHVNNANLKLAKSNAVSGTELANTRLALAEAKAEVKIKSHIVKQCSITAPFRGEVVKLHVNAHENVSSGQDLVDILDNQDFVIELIVPSKWLAWLKVGQQFSIKINETQKTYQAQVTKIVSRIDAVSQTIHILAKIVGSTTGLVAGMSGQANFKATVN